jgi:regulator of RNase E activity RraB
MLEIFSATIAGIKIVQETFDKISSTLDKAQHIGEIAHHVDEFLNGYDQVQKDRFKRNSASNVFSINNVAQEVIDAKLASEKRQEIATMIDLRFGWGTWQNILKIRADRIKAERERIKKERILRIKRRNEIMKQIETGSIIVLVIIAILTIMYFGFIYD